jgi:pantoate--beta-alanine ligase
LSPDQRRRALALSQSLKLAEAAHAAGETSAEKIRDLMLAHIAAVGGVKVEYIAIVRDGAVDEVSTIDGPTTIALAARVGATRLIDNTRLG